MSTHLTGEDLRALSYALDQMSKVTTEHGVQFGGYQDAHITFRGEVMRIVWQEPAQGDDAAAGRYVLDMPDVQY